MEEDQRIPKRRKLNGGSSETSAGLGAIKRETSEAGPLPSEPSNRSLPPSDGPATHPRAANSQGSGAATAPSDGTQPTVDPPFASAATSGAGPPPDGPGPPEGTAASSAATAADPPVHVTSGAYTQREEFLQRQEDEGEISFEYVRNDGQPTSSIWLISLKNIFSKQLPNMPREYIARLVLDRRHRSVAIVRRRSSVVGGITYRIFDSQTFGEIAFCAVTANEQVKGFGTRLMNYTKEYAKTQDQLTHFLTYADNNAVGYFAKQGFTKEITLDKERWVGYIKDYDGGTLMECVLYARIPYTRFPDMIRQQRESLDAQIRTMSKSHIIYPGLEAFKKGPRRQLDIGSIPGVREAGWTPDDSAPPSFKLLMNGQTVEPRPDALQRFMGAALRALTVHEDAWPFLEPVSAQDVPDYYEIIKDPVDLQTVEKQLKGGKYYLTLDIFAADIRRMCANARFYNSADTIYYKLANKLELFFEQYLSAHLIFEQ